MKKEQGTKEYLEFVKEFQSCLSLLTEDGQAQFTFRRNGGEEGKEDFLEVELCGMENGVHIQRFHMKDIYRSYEEGREMEELLLDAKRCLEYCEEIGRNSPLGFQEDYEAIKDRLVIRAINYDNNVQRLQSGVYELIGDIALTLYIDIGNFEGLYSSSMVSWAVMEKWGKSRKQVLAEAKENTYRLYPPRLFNLQEVSRLGDPDYGIFMEEVASADIRAEDSMLFVTRKFHLNGGVSVFLPGVAKRLGELLESDLYFAFTSINEAAVHDCTRITPDAVREGLDRLDDNPENDEIFLSHKVYHYSRENDEITALSS